MSLKILAVGRKNLVRRLSDSLACAGIDIVDQPDISEAIIQLKKDKFDLALVDAYHPEVESVCRRISWQCRIPVVIIINETQVDWKLLRRLDVDGFISAETSGSEMVACINSIALRKHFLAAHTGILIIDDDEETREALQLAFQFYWPESRIYSASCGNEGVALAANEAIDVIILDLALPDIHGCDVLSRIRSFSHVPVIILSATRKQDNIFRCIQLGASDYIFKPFKQLELMSRIRQVVSLGSAVSRV
jgi:DNA-binding response OmpR family regulator